MRTSEKENGSLWAAMSAKQLNECLDVVKRKELTATIFFVVASIVTTALAFLSVNAWTTLGTAGFASLSALWIFNTFYMAHLSRKAVVDELSRRADNVHRERFLELLPIAAADVVSDRLTEGERAFVEAVGDLDDNRLRALFSFIRADLDAGRVFSTDARALAYYRLHPQRADALKTGLL